MKKKIKSSQRQTKLTGSYKKRVYLLGFYQTSMMELKAVDYCRKEVPSTKNEVFH